MKFDGEQDVCHNRNAWKAIAQMRSGAAEMARNPRSKTGLICRNQHGVLP
jgi:hypothetical protein